jgi:hypothetical protein
MFGISNFDCGETSENNCWNFETLRLIKPAGFHLLASFSRLLAVACWLPHLSNLSVLSLACWLSPAGCRLLSLNAAIWTGDNVWDFEF